MARLSVTFVGVARLSVTFVGVAHVGCEPNILIAMPTCLDVWCGTHSGRNAVIVS